MVIRAVDHSDAHFFTGELLRCLKPTKSRSNNHHLRFFGRGVFHGIRMFAEGKPKRGFIVVASLPATPSPATAEQRGPARDVELFRAHACHVAGWYFQSYEVKSRADQTAKTVVCIATNAIFLALCRNRLPAARHVSQWQNASRSPRAEKC